MHLYGKLIVAFYILFIDIGTIYAYELGTHARLTEQAYNRSALATDPTLLKNLGLANLYPFEPLGKMYYDVAGTTVYSRNADSFSREKNRMPNPDTEAFTFKGWLMRGAIREDDVNIGTNPKDDPYSNLLRVLSHFYDPVNKAPLNGYGIPDSWSGGAYKHTAPAWAIGVSNRERRVAG